MVALLHTHTSHFVHVAHAWVFSTLANVLHVFSTSPLVHFLATWHKGWDFRNRSASRWLRVIALERESSVCLKFDQSGLQGIGPCRHQLGKSKTCLYVYNCFTLVEDTCIQALSRSDWHRVCLLATTTTTKTTTATVCGTCYLVSRFLELMWLMLLFLQCYIVSQPTFVLGGFSKC